MKSAIENHIMVNRTARYFTLGELNGSTKAVWIILHGHRQHAGKFIETFSELAQEDHYIIAPEGLSRLYVTGDSGEVGASWMTKEDRENEIKDYVNYLDKLFYEVIESKRNNFNFKVYALGFSQGAATLTRWLAMGKSKVDKIISWTGSIGQEVDYSKSESFKSSEVHLVFSNNDPYYTDDFYKTQVKILQNCGIEPKLHYFDGRHEVNVKLIKELRFY
jgi:predicted esterase